MSSAPRQRDVPGAYLTRRPYYWWLASPITDTELEEAHRDDPEFVYRLLVDEARWAGEPMSTRTAWRIYSHMGWWSAGSPIAARLATRPAGPRRPARCRR